MTGLWGYEEKTDVGFQDLHSKKKKKKPSEHSELCRDIEMEDEELAFYKFLL